MKKLLFLFFTLNLNILIFISCEEPCVTKEKGIVHLSSSDKLIVPYKGLEKLIFIDSIGDTMKFTGSKRKSELEQTMGKYRQTGGADCPTEMWFLENNKIIFNDTINKYIIFFYIRSADPLWNIKKYLYISMQSNKSNLEDWKSTQIFNFDNRNLLNSTDTNNCKLSFNSNLIIGSKTYSSVYIFVKQNLNLFPDSYPQFIYYTINEGIIGFKTKNKHYWYLKT